MTISIYFKHMNTEAQLEVGSTHQDAAQPQTAPALPPSETEETIAVSPNQPPQPMVDGQAQYYSPVGIILATCALVTAIGRALKPRG